MSNMWSPFVVFIFGLLFERVTRCVTLEWTGALVDNATVRACPGQDLTLQWNFTHTPKEKIVEVEWRYAQNQGAAETVLGTEVHGRFFGDARVKAAPGAGLTLTHVTTGDAGAYTLMVVLNEGGTHSTHTTTSRVIVTDDPVTPDDLGLRATVAGATVANTHGHYHLALSCGPFDPAWAPQVDVVWTTPDNVSLPSTYRQNGAFYLAVPNPPRGGEYTCKVSESSPAAACIAPDSPVQRGATVLVDATKGRQLVLNATITGMAKENQALKDRLNSLTGCSVKAGGNCSAADQCVDNAVCYDGQCVCQDSFFNNNGTCSPRLTAGEACDAALQAPRQCPDNANCTNGTCACSGGHHNEGGVCVSGMEPTCQGLGISVRDDPWRATTHGDGSHCDDRSPKLVGWYRFTLEGRNATIPTACVQKNHCNTDAPLWIDMEGGTIPTPGTERKVKVCANWEDSCCHWSHNITVRNCGTFLAYRLNGTPHCSLAYCVE